MVEGSTQSWAGDSGGAPAATKLLLVLVPIGSYRRVSSDPASRAGAGAQSAG